MDDRADLPRPESSSADLGALLRDPVMKSVALLRPEAPSYEAGPLPARPKKRSGGKVGRRAMKFVRRVHLYAGLALVPFVTLYGVTAFLFNHPGVWSPTEVRYLSANEVDAAGRAHLGPPAQMAQQVVDELGQDGWAIDPATKSSFQGRMFLSATLDATDYSLLIDEPDGGARVFQRPTRSSSHEQELTSGETDKLEVGSDALDALRGAATALVLPEAGDDAEVRWRVRSTPRLEFGMLDEEGAPYLATYNLRDGSLEVSPAAEPETAGTVRSFLLRLHTAHGVPATWGIDFWWSILVDVMAIAMVVWAGSGLLMWWQMKNLRRVGIITLVLCAIGTTILVSAQWQNLA
ncbi:MAG: hypothetical protein AAF628_05200 [Planctomycetota bacterium]